MPIYEYKCMECKNGFEYLVIGSDKDISCPICDSKKVERKISVCNFKDSKNYLSSAESSGCSSCSGGSCSTCH